MKKRIIFLLLCFAMCLSLLSVGSLADSGDLAATFSGGSGTADDPYQICNSAQLAALAKLISSGTSCEDICFVLTADIGSGTGDNAPVSTVIGASSSFCGHFDGAGHTVTLDITSDASNTALFGFLKGSISNLTTAGTVTCTNNVVGGVCAHNRGTIINCHNKATVSGTSTQSYNVGGVCGCNRGSILNCTNLGHVKSETKNVGGVCGQNEGKIADSGNSGSVTSKSSDAGGVCGYNSYAGTLLHCTNHGSVVSVGDNTGGLCGNNSGSICNSYSVGNVTSSGNHTGGVCGDNNGTIDNCYSVGRVTSADSNAGGVCGYSYTSVHNCYYNSDTCSCDNGFGQGLSAAACTGTGSGSLLSYMNLYVGSVSYPYPDNWYIWDAGDPGPVFHVHVCDRENTDDDYLRSKADCLHPDLYYRSCVCGYCDRDEDNLFAFGTANGHYWDYRTESRKADHDTLYAYCLNCELSAALTLHAPEGPLVEDGSTGFSATFTDDDGLWNKYFGSYPTIYYLRGDSAHPVTDVPTEADDYTARITAGAGTHWAEATTTFTILPASVTYLDENGKPQTCTDYTAVSGTVPVWGAEGEETWYAVSGTVELDSVTVLGDVHLILMDGCKLTVNDGGKKANPGGILVASNNSLTVYAQSDDESMGALTSYGSSSRAGIGGGDHGAGGNITITGGSVTATGKYSAGVGGGYYGAGGNITINGGTVEAIGSSGGAGIGGGNYGDGGTIAVSDGSVTATGYAGGAGVGGGKNGAGGTVIISGGSVNATATGNNGGAGVGSGSKGAGGTVAISGGSITVYGIDGGAGIGSGANATEQVAVTLGAGLTLADADSEDPIFDWQAAIAVSGKTLEFKVIRLDPVTYLDADGAAQECTTYRTVISVEKLPTVWSTGWYVADGTGLNLSDVTVSGDVNLILTDSCDLTATGSDGNPGIRVEGDSSLTIFAQSDGENMGRLTATGKEGAGIGGESASGGSITINGGSIVATGGDGGAGIGGGTITLNGGSVTATGTKGGAGIGGGKNAASGNIAINGGSITATGTEGGAGIGNGANVTIPAAVTLAAGKALMDADGGLIADWQTDIAKSDTTVSFTVVTAPVFTSTSLTLGNEIGLNFYMNIPEDCAGGTVSATVGGVEIPADKITNPADGKYSVPLNVLQMADTVVLTYTYDGGKKSVSREYSAERYLKLAQRKATGDALVRLIDATYAYGYYSQQFLSEANGFTLGKAYAALENGGSTPAVEAAAAALENYALSVTGESENVTDVKLSLRMDAKTTLRVYFAANETPTVTLKKGGELDVQYDTDKELYYVDVASLSAHQLGNTYTLNADGKTVTVSALAYCNQVMKADTSYTYAKQFAAAIYEYYTAVIAYRAG